jgi:ribonuclease HI
VAYTDGSTGPNRNDPSGSSVIFAKGESVTSTHAFPLITMGNNYQSEAAAILSALTLTPSMVNLKIYTDSKSCIDAINRGRGYDPTTGKFTGVYHVSQRRRILTAARPLITCIRTMITERQGRVELTHVKAHTGGTDRHSRLNDVADAEANKARIAGTKNPALVPPAGYAGEEKVSLVLKGWVTTGSYRRTLLHLAAARALDRQKKGGNGHQNHLTRRHGKEILKFCKVVKRSKDPMLNKYGALAITRWLPTESVRLSRERATSNAGRGASCKLCGAAEETVEHALCWCEGRHAAAPRAHSRDKALEAMVVPEPADPPHPTVFGKPRRVRAWFDPTGHTYIDVCPEVSIKAVKACETFDPLAGFMGIIPAPAEEILGWTRVGRDGWRRCSLQETRDRTDRLRASLVWGGMHTWLARCKAMDEWFKSEAAKAHRRQVALALARRSAKRARLKEGGIANTERGPRHHPYARSNPRPQRTQEARTRDTSGLRGFYVSSVDAIDEAMIEAETRKRLQQDSETGRLKLAWF